MRKEIEIAGKVCIYYLSMAGVDQLEDAVYCVLCAVTPPIGILFRWQIGLEDRIENQHRRHHHCAIADGGYAQRTLLPPGLRDVHPPHREWSIGPTFQFLRQFVQPSLCTVRFDVLERLIVYSSCAAISLATFVGKSQNVSSVHFVVQSIETKVRRSLRFVVQRCL